MAQNQSSAAVEDNNLDEMCRRVAQREAENGRPRQVLHAWHEGRFNMVLSVWQQAELTEVVSRPTTVRQFRITLTELTELFARMSSVTPTVPGPRTAIPLRDPKDEHILATALSSEVRYLVTGDRDLLVHQGDPHLDQLQIVTVAQFLDVLDE